MSIYGPDASDAAIAELAEVYFAVLADPESRAAILAHRAALEQPVSADVVVPPGRVEAPSRRRGAVGDQAVA